MILPETGVLMVRPRWAVVMEPYARLLSAPEADEEITGHLRGGDVIEIVEIGTTQYMSSGSDEPWYLVRSGENQGWLMSTAVALFGSRNQAENYAAADNYAAAQNHAPAQNAATAQAEASLQAGE